MSGTRSEERGVCRRQSHRWQKGGGKGGGGGDLLVLVGREVLFRGSLRLLQLCSVLTGIHIQVLKHTLMRAHAHTLPQSYYRTKTFSLI